MVAVENSIDVGNIQWTFFDCLFNPLMLEQHARQLLVTYLVILLSGFGGAMMAAIGLMTGGALTTRYNLKIHQMAFFILISNAIFCICLASLMLVSCPQNDELHISR